MHPKIIIARRSQPIAELERKAKKAQRRRWPTIEAKDLAFAKDHQWQLAFRASATPPINFCYLCHGFGADWDEATKVYRQPIRHQPRCVFAPGQPTVYPGPSYDEVNGAAMAA